MKSNPAASARCASATSCFGPACSPITVYPNATMPRSSRSTMARLPNRADAIPRSWGRSAVGFEPDQDAAVGFVYRIAAQVEHRHRPALRGDPDVAACAVPVPAVVAARDAVPLDDSVAGEAHPHVGAEP